MEAPPHQVVQSFFLNHIFSSSRMAQGPIKLSERNGLVSLTLFAAASPSSLTQSRWSPPCRFVFEELATFEGVDY